MPKIVDHDERRDEIVFAAVRIIARQGLEAATVRSIAAEAGYSSGVLDHYFRGKDDILVKALEASHRRIKMRWRKLLRGRRGFDALRRLLLDNLPTDAQHRDETRLEMQFWARSAGDVELTTVLQREAAVFRRTVIRYVEEAVADADLPAGTDAAETAERLLALMDGISVRAVNEPRKFPARRQVGMMESALEGLQTR